MGRSCAVFGDVRCSVESENGEQGGVDPPLLLRGEMACEITKTPGVDGTDLLDENPSSGAIDVDLGPKRRWLGARRRWCHQHDRPRKKGVGLHNDTEATSSLFVPYPLGESQDEDVTPTHGGSP